VVITIPAGPPETLHLFVVQPPPCRILEVLPTNLLTCPLLFRRLEPRFEPGLHSNAKRRVERNVSRVPAHLRRLRRAAARRAYLHERITERLDLKGPGGVGGGRKDEGL